MHDRGSPERESTVTLENAAFVADLKSLHLPMQDRTRISAQNWEKLSMAEAATQ